MAMRAAGVLRARPAAASVAATCCRSMGSFSREELKELEEDMESRVRARMEQRFDARVREIVRSEARKILAGEVAKINQEKNIPLLMKNEENKRELPFKSKLAEHKLWLTMRFNAADQAMRKSSCEVTTTANLFSSECDRRDHNAALKSKLVEGKHELFSDSVAARQVQAQLSLLKGMLYVISVPSAIYGAVTRFNAKGGRK
ncbi:unnamed protein product [Urochloa humidicola]